jgi:hypothetical protein
VWSIIATDLGIWPAIKDAHLLSDKMYASDSIRGKIAELLIFYDKIIIPTGNFQVLPIMRLVLGDFIFTELIRNKSIVFARYNKWFGYIGNGGGLSFFTVSDGENSKFIAPNGNLATSHFKPLDECIDIALANTVAPEEKLNNHSIKNILIDGTVNVLNDFGHDEFRSETYNDITKSALLSEFMMVRSSGKHLDRLGGINSNQVRVYNPEVAAEPGESPQIRALLRVAFENFSLSIAEESKADIFSGDSKTVDIVNSKISRTLHGSDVSSAFYSISQFNGIPDIGKLFSEKKLSPEKLYEMRSEKYAKEFREWISTSGNSSADIVESYRESIIKQSIADSLPLKLVRFAATKIATALDPTVGLTGSIVDSFLLKKWLPRNMPHLYLSNMKKSVLANAPIVRSNLGRNDSCHCGSGKKYKKCHGK